MELITQLSVIALAAEEKEAENQAFRTYLGSQESADIDRLVQELDAIVTPQIDCTKCGNCCRSLMINITAAELTNLAAHLNRSEADVTDEYIETGSSNSLMIINAIPCHFLTGNCCSIYEQRFGECREFPGLYRPRFTSRLFAMLMHYGRCPIIYNVLEEMKKRLAFEWTE